MGPRVCISNTLPSDVDAVQGARFENPWPSLPLPSLVIKEVNFISRSFDVWDTDTQNTIRNPKFGRVD